MLHLIQEQILNTVFTANDLGDPRIMGLGLVRSVWSGSCANSLVLVIGWDMEGVLRKRASGVGSSNKRDSPRV
jgi:hypothetical protein